MLKIKREKLNGLSCCNIVRERFLNVIRERFLNVIRGLFLNVIRGLRPANLDCRITSGNDYRVVQCGRSMIEMLGVLAIIGVLSVGGIAGYSKAMTKFKTNQIIDQVSTIVTNVKTLYAQQKSYVNLDTETAYMLGAIPDEMASDCDLGSSCASNAFNGAIYVGHPAHYGDGQSFVIVYEGLPKEACIALMTNNWGNKSSLIAMRASGYAETNQFMDSDVTCGGDNRVMCPVNPEEAARVCDCDEGNTCVVSWKFE